MVYFGCTSRPKLQMGLWDPQYRITVKQKLTKTTFPNITFCSINRRKTSVSFSCQQIINRFYHQTFGNIWAIICASLVKFWLDLAKLWLFSMIPISSLQCIKIIQVLCGKFETYELEILQWLEMKFLLTFMISMWSIKAFEVTFEIVQLSLREF